MNNIISKMFSGMKFLSNHGDRIHAYITPSHRQVIKTIHNGIKHSAVRYPNGTIVETIVHRR